MTQFTTPPGRPDFGIGTVNEPSPKGGSNALKWVIVVVVGLPVTGIVLLGGVCTYIGVVGPGTLVIAGRQMPARFVSQIRDLGILQTDEKIEYFYSDAMANIEDGFYLLTDRSVVVYSRAFEEPAIVVPFERIVDVEGVFSDSWLDDGLIVLSLSDGTEVSFPVASEGGGDRRMFTALKKKISSTPN